ncbi:MAG: META domain-containing protein [Gammaproteobacteria bacterium]|jgi:heat shock protein HslJ
MKTFTLLMLIVCGSGCSAAPDQPHGSDFPGADNRVDARQPIAPAGLENVDWQLREYLGDAGETLAVLPGTTVDARFSNGQVGGSTGCNRFFASYTHAENNRLVLAPGIGATRMACPEAIERQEQRYLALLPLVASWRRHDDTLQLLDKDRELLLVYTAAKPVQLEGSSWQASGINNGRGGVVSGRSTGLATATFTSETISGSAGCNSFSATYQAKGNRLTIGPAATTRKHCAEPEGIMQQEQEYLDALARVHTFTLKTGRLELRDVNGALQVSYRARGD